ncbi:MAG: amidohydrolase [Oscillospiraceae bacterium]
MLILKQGTLMTMCEDPFVGDIAIEDGKIIGIGRHLPIPGGAQVLDVSGKTVLPGIVDAHSHIGLFESGTRETDHNEKVDPIAPQLRGIDGINPLDSAFADALEAGITTCVTGPGSINLIGGTFTAVKSYSCNNTVEGMLLRQPVAMKAALGENPKFRYTEMNRSPKSRLACAALLRQALMDAADYNPDSSPKNPACEALLPVLSGKLPLKIHVHRASDIETAIRIAEEFQIRYTLDHCSEGYLIPHRLLDALQKRCDGIILGPLMIYKRKLECANKLGVKLPVRLHQEGIPFAISTDFPETIPRGMIPQVALSVAEGLPEREALQAITIVPARIIGIDDRVGSLEVGKDADLAIFSGHPLHYSSLCIMTFVGGHLAYERRNI